MTKIIIEIPQKTLDNAIKEIENVNDELANYELDLVAKIKAKMEVLNKIKKKAPKNNAKVEAMIVAKTEELELLNNKIEETISRSLEGFLIDTVKNLANNYVISQKS